MSDIVGRRQIGGIARRGRRFRRRSSGETWITRGPVNKPIGSVSYLVGESKSIMGGVKITIGVDPSGYGESGAGMNLKWINIKNRVVPGRKLLFLKDASQLGCHATANCRQSDINGSDIIVSGIVRRIDLLPGVGEAFALA